MNRKIKHHYSAQGEQEKKDLPDYLAQGEQARLFPVLPGKYKEHQTTSIVLACMAKIDEFGDRLLESIGRSVGPRTKIKTYTEIGFESRWRPDGLIVLQTPRKEWRALVETKVGKNNLDPEQVEKYRNLAKDNAIDCVITISNQFATTPSAHPLAEVNKNNNDKRLSRIPVYHWSWMYIFTEVDLLLRQEKVSDVSQRMLLNELKNFLNETSGVSSFVDMPRAWGKINELVLSGAPIPKKSEEAKIVIDSWHQEIRDLTLIMSRMTETEVSQGITRKHLNNASLRVKDETVHLCEEKQLTAILKIPDAAAEVDVVADLSRRCVDVGMTLQAPENVSTKDCVNWLLRQIKAEKNDLYLKILWPKKSPTTQHKIVALRKDVDIASRKKEHLTPSGFHLFTSKSLGNRFKDGKVFIKNLEKAVCDFYDHYGSNLVAWEKPAPKIKEDRKSPQDVTPEALSDESSNFDLS